MNVKIACIQMASKPFDWKYNMKKAELFIRKAADGGADICLLPELFVPGYAHHLNNFKYAETLNGKTISFLIKLSKRVNTYIAGTFIEKSDKDFYNTMFLISPLDGLLGYYRKIFVYGLEQIFWRPGDKGAVIKTEFGKIGLGICADMHFLDLWKYYAEKVDLILISSAWLDYPTIINLSYTNFENMLLRTLPVKISETLQVPVAYCNAVHGFSKLPVLGELYCAGHSKIVQNGKILASINSRMEKIIESEIRISQSRMGSKNIDFKIFDNWVNYPLPAKLPKVLIEKVSPILAGNIYKILKRNYL